MDCREAFENQFSFAAKPNDDASVPPSQIANYFAYHCPQFYTFRQTLIDPQWYGKDCDDYFPAEYHIFLLQNLMMMLLFLFHK